MNKKLEREVAQLKQQIISYKKEMEDIQSRCLIELRSESSEELPYNEQLLNKIIGSNSDSVLQKQIPEIIKLFLLRIKELETALESIEVEFDEKNQKLDSLIQREKSFRSEKSDSLRESMASHMYSSHHPESKAVMDEGRLAEARPKVIH